jgi:hypothetical protein
VHFVLQRMARETWNTIADADAKAIMLDALRRVQDALNDIATQLQRISGWQPAEAAGPGVVNAAHSVAAITQ